MGQHELIALARVILKPHEKDWMPELDEWEAVVKAFATDRLEGAIEDCVHEWRQMMEREKAERAMAAAEVMAPR